MSEFSYKLVTTANEMEEAFKVRRQVFIEEQGIPEEIELDEYDAEAMHMVARDGDRIIGTARVQFPSAGLAKIERMAVLGSFRRRGIGSGIIYFLSEELKNRQVEEAFLHAQQTVTGFYKSCGFKETGAPFLEAGIKHIEMRKRL